MKDLRGWLGVLWLWSSVGVGQVKAEDTQAYRKEIVSLYQQGRGLLETREYQQALVKLLAAYDLLRRMEMAARKEEEKEEVLQNQIRFFFILGRTYHLSRDLGSASHFYRRCVLRSPAARPCLSAAKYLREIQPQTLALLEVTSQPSGVTVILKDTLGEMHRLQTPFRRSFWPGEWQITLLPPTGYLPLERRAKLRPRGQAEIHLTLEKKTIARLPPPRRLQRHTPTPAPQALSWPAILAWTCLGLAVAGGIVGGALIGVSHSSFSHVEKGLGQPEALSGLSNESLWQTYERAQGMQTGAAIAFSVAGVAALGTVGFFLLSRAFPPPPLPTSALQPPLGITPTGRMSVLLP